MQFKLQHYRLQSPPSEGLPLHLNTSLAIAKSFLRSCGLPILRILSFATLHPNTNNQPTKIRNRGFSHRMATRALVSRLMTMTRDWDFNQQTMTEFQCSPRSTMKVDRCYNLPTETFTVKKLSWSTKKFVNRSKSKWKSATQRTAKWRAVWTKWERSLIRLMKTCDWFCVNYVP